MRLEVSPASEDDGVWLRDRLLHREPERVLWAQDSLGSEDRQEIAEPHNTQGVTVSDRRHLNDLAPDQLQPRIRRESTLFPRAFELFDGQELLLDRHRHEPPPPPFYSVSETEMLSHRFAWRELCRVFPRSGSSGPCVPLGLPGIL